MRQNPWKRLSRCILGAYIAALCCTDTCYGVSGVPPHAKDQPWFTGPLLTPTARVISPGHLNIEPYLYLNCKTGQYNGDWKAKSIPKVYQVNPQLQFKCGFIKNFDFSISPQSFISWSQGHVTSSFGDLPIGIDYQLYEGKEHSWLTYAKFSIQETFPTGRYDRLNPNAKGTDIGGAGAFGTQFGLGISKLVKFENGNYMNSRAFISTTLYSHVNVTGLNAYGGGPDTSGTVLPGQNFSFLAGTEYSITANWTLAFDIQITCNNKTSFRGFTLTAMGSPSSVQYSIAPAIEYNWNDHLGIIIGPWFTVAGRNSSQFCNIVAALNYVF